MRIFNNFTFINFGYLIIHILCVEVLKKNDNKKIYDNHIVFESKEFAVEDKMYFTIKSECDCDDYLYYKYYDNLEDINDYINPTLYISHKSETATRVNGNIKSLTRKFTIKKKKEDLSNLRGDYLYLKYNCYCSGSIEFENTSSDDDSTTIILVVVFVLFAIVIGILVWRCYRRRKLRMAHYQENYNNQVNYYYPQMQMPMPVYQQYGNQAIVYQNPNANQNVKVVYVKPNKANNMNIPPKMQEIGHGAAPGEISQNSSNRESFDKSQI